MTLNKQALIEATKKRKKKNPYSSVTYTTGDVALNINRFNQAFGTTEGGEVGIGGEGSLCEAKRYVRRYYFRPMNKFASNNNARLYLYSTYLTANRACLLSRRGQQKDCRANARQPFL